MGAKAAAYFTEAEKQWGMLGKLKLAGIAKMTSGQANTLEDTRELIARFENAMAELRKESGGDKADKSPEGREVVAGTADAATLRRHIQAYLDLMTQRSLVLGNVQETIRRVNEIAVNTLDIERVSVWFLDQARTKITCADIYIRKDRSHSSGVELFAKDFAPYFLALNTERTIAAHDAHKDPRTSCFSVSYLKPLGINSMLDVPIWVNGRMIGVICHEHVGPARSWNADEEKFAYLMSSFVALAHES